MRIRSKLTVYFFAISIIPLLGVAFFIFHYSEKVIQNRIVDHMNTTVILKQQQFEAWLDQAVTAFDIVSVSIQTYVADYLFYQQLYEQHDGPIPHDDHTIHMQRRDTFNKELSVFLQQSHEFDELFLIRVPYGEVQLSSDETQIGKIKTDESYFYEGQKNLFISDIEYSNDLKKNILLIAAPILVDDHVEYVFAARVKLDKINALMSLRDGLGQTGETYLVNHLNLFVTNPPNNTKSQFKNIFTEGVNHCLAGHSGFGFYKNYLDHPVIGSYRWLPERKLCVMTEINQSEIFAPTEQLKLIVSLIIFFILSSLFFVGYFISESFVHPISRLTRYAQSIYRENFQKKISSQSLNRTDELGDMARAFDVMTQRLSQSFLETKNIVQTIPDTLFALDDQGRIQLINRAGKNLLKLSEKSIYNQPIVNYIHPSSRKTSGIDFFDLKNQKPFYNVDIDFVDDHHKKIPIQLSGMPIKMSSSSRYAFILAAKDMREFKRYTKNRVQQITPILNRISVGDFSQRIELPEKEDEFTNVIVAVDLMVNNLKQLLDENKTKTDLLESSEKKLKESHRYLEKANRSIEHEKAKTDSLLAGIGESIITIDLNGNIIFMNAIAEKLFGKSMNQVLGLPYSKSFRFENEKGHEILPNVPPLSTAIKSGKPVFTTLYFVKDGKTKIPLAATISPFIFENKMLGIVTTFRDITKEKEIDKAKSEFVSLASHQLRTPLTGIKWLIQVAMKKGTLNKTQKEFLTDALSSNRRMISLVNDLLNVSRLETNSLSVLPESYDVKHLVKELINEAKPAAAKKHVTLQFKNPQGHLAAFFDVQLVGQVISTLLTNAIDYTDEHKKITASVSKTKTTFSISIADQGIGISKEDQKNLFIKFYRSAEASKYSTRGSGLGLYIVKKILDVCSGKVKCQSTVGKGTTFTVTFPLKMKSNEGLKTLMKEKYS